MTDVSRDHPEVVSKSAFAEIIRVSAPRVSQYVREGLPTENGKIRVSAGLEWLRRRTDPVKRAQQGKTPLPIKGRTTATADTSGEDLGEIQALIALQRLRRETAKADRDEMARDADQKSLIRRDVVETAIFGWTRAQRDSWIAWVSRAAPELADQLQTDIGRIYPILDKMVREQLDAITRLPAPRMDDEGKDDDDAE